jgi:excisionase family DNA binding protein
MTLTEAAASLGVTAATLRQQIANGKLTAAKRGRDWWVQPKEVERYRQESRRQTMIEGLIEDAEWHQELAREGMAAAPELPE